MKRKMLIWGALVLVVLGAAGFFFWRMMSQPMFKPGSVAEGRSLQPPAVQPFASRWTVAEGVELDYFATGSGRNVVTVHGGPGMPWEGPAPAFDLLGDDFKFYYYDQRGCGDSTRPFDTFSSEEGQWAKIQKLESTLGMAEQVADLERIRRILGDEKLIVVGHSYGALLAALYAAEFPEAVGALILIAPPDLLKMPSQHGGLFDNIRKRLPASEHAEYDAWVEEYFDLGGAFAKSEAELQALDVKLGPYWNQAMENPAPAELQPSAGSAGAWMARAQYFSMGRTHDWSPQLAKITAPTLIVHGSEDLQPLAVAEMFRDAIPNSSIEVIEGADHFPFVTHPSELAAVMRPALQQSR